MFAVRQTMVIASLFDNDGGWMVLLVCDEGQKILAGSRFFNQFDEYEYRGQRVNPRRIRRIVLGAIV